MDNVKQLRKIKKDYGLNSGQIADLLCVSKRAVDSWLASESNANYRTVRDYRITNLKRALKHRKKV